MCSHRRGLSYCRRATALEDTPPSRRLIELCTAFCPAKSPHPILPLLFLDVLQEIAAQAVPAPIINKHLWSSGYDVSLTR